MNNIRKHMASLAPGMALAARERVQAVTEIKAQTASSLRSFAAERQQMAKTLRSDLSADRVNRSAEVLDLLQNAEAMSEGFRLEHCDMGQALRESLAESKEAVASSVASLFKEFSKDRADFAKSLRRMAKAQGTELAKDRRDRSHAVTQLIRSFTKAHHQMAKLQSAGLAKARRDRSHLLAELMQSFRGHQGHALRQLVKGMAKAVPATLAPPPSASVIHPVPVKPSVVLAPAAPVKPAPVAAPVAAPRAATAKPAAKAAPVSSKPWPIAPPRGVVAAPVVKKAAVKAAPAKAARLKAARPAAKALKAKKK